MSADNSTKNIQAAVSFMADALTGDIYASAAFGAASALIAKAHARGSDITDDELNTLIAQGDDLARVALEAAIAKAQ